jgi:hypothetical protein
MGHNGIWKENGEALIGDVLPFEDIAVYPW